MTLVGFAGFLIALSAVYFANFNGLRIRIVVFSLLMVVHTAAALAFYLYVQGGATSDAVLYYYDDIGLYGRISGFGTAVILAVVQEMRIAVGGTFFDYFMLFQATGFWGVVIIMKIIQEVFEEVGAEPSGWIYLPLFLPGLHFWTAAIGKDAPIFLAIALACWASMRMSKRLLAMCLAIILMILVRPHIALVAVIAVAVSALVGGQTKFIVKALIMAGIAGAGIVLATEIGNFIGNSRSGSMTGFMEDWGEKVEGSGADQSILQASLPIKILSLWFRPFFLDAENVMGYIASLENLVLLGMAVFLIRHFGTVRTLFFKVAHVRFAAVALVALTVVLALVNFNVGLGLRQKMMAMPPLLVILGTVLAFRAGQRIQQRELAQVQFEAARRSPAAYLGG